MSIKKLIFGGMFAAAILLTGCNFFPKNVGNDSGENGSEENGGGSGTSERDYEYKSIGEKSKNLDFIFSTNSVGTVTITMERSEWNQMLTNFDYFYKNENCVKFKEFEYSKDGKNWKLEKGGGIRLRGNTSRFRPQGKDYATDKFGNRKMNADWSSDYYSYAADCPDTDYRQAHFKVDFEEFLEDGDEQKLAGCMKGVALKRMDGSCTKEIFCYDLFHRYGIWTAPRASHTRVFFNFIEEDGSVTNVNFGVYEMFEEVNKQSLKARDKDENSASNAWKNSKGNLWKCAGGDLTNPWARMDCEKIEITEFSEDGIPLNYIWDQPTYDLKTNKDDVGKKAAIDEFSGFIADLNSLPDVINDDDTDSIKEIKNFYDKWFDVEFFLKTYAVNILVGMDDDYWANANNYYLYFADTPKDGRKVYFIPFDYDNTIGASIQDSNGVVGIEQNPLEWGRGRNRPLMDKIIQVPEYRELFKKLLIEVSARDSEWNYEKCSARWNSYWAMVNPYLWSPDLSGEICTMGAWDNCYNAFKTGGKSLVNKANNIYDYTRECILNNLKKDSGGSIIFDLNGGNINGSTASVKVEYAAGKIFTLSDLIANPKKTGYAFAGWTETKDGEDFVSIPSVDKVYARWKLYADIKDLYIYELEPGMEGYDSEYEGIQIKILNVPKFAEDGGEARVRQIFVNDVRVSDESWRGSVMRSDIWRFPYTEKDKEYQIYVKYLNKDYWSELMSSNKITVKASSGKGKFVLETKRLNFDFVENIISFTPQPVIFVAGKQIDASYNPGYFECTFNDPNWAWDAYPTINDYKVEPFDVLKSIDPKKVDSALKTQVETKMRYIVRSEENSNKYGDYRLEIELSGDRFKLTDTRVHAQIIQDDENRPGVVIKFPVEDYPEETSIRRIRVNNNLASDIRSYSEHEGTMVWSEEWYYPFVDAGKEYTFSVEYLDKDWNQVLKLPDLKVKATSGMGEIQVVQSPEYRVIDNVIEWTKQPVMSMGGKVLTQEDFAYYNRNGDRFGYKIALNIVLNTNNWSWCFDKVECSYELESFDVLEYCKKHNPDNASKTASNPCFIYLELVYGNNWDVNDGPYGRYEYEILSDSSKMNFTLSE